MLIVFLLQMMPFLSIWNHCNNNFFFTFWVIFWNIGSIYFFFFSIQNIKSNCYFIFLNFFSNQLFWWKLYSFSVIFTYKRFNFSYSLCIFFLFLHDLVRLLQRIQKNEIYRFYFFIQSREFIYDPVRLGFILWHL